MNDIEKTIKIIDEDLDFIDKCGTKKDIQKKKELEILKQSLKEQLERENPKPLTLEELGNLVEEPIWIETGEISVDEQIVGYYEILERITDEPTKVFWFTRRVRGFLASNYGITWLAYRHKPNTGEANNEGE